MARSERSGHTTTDHDFIRRWVEERGGWPARVAGTSRGNDAGLIRIDFPGYSGEGSLEQIEWDEWFEGFEANQLAFLHRDMDHGGGDLDRFNKLISRSGDDDGEEGEGGGRGGSSARGRGASGGRSGPARKSGASEGKASSGRGGGARKAASTGGGRGGASTTADSGEKGNGKASSGRGGSARKAGAADGGTSSGRGGSARKSESKGAGNGRRGAASAAADTGAKSTGATGGAKAGSRAGDSGGPGNNRELRALLLHDLGDLLSAERLFLASTRTLAREAQDPEVRTRVEQHVGETEGQIERLKEAFGALGERPRAVTCEAALGLKEEHDSFKSEEKPSRQLLSAYGLGSGLRVEHYEIAAYRSAIELAAALGERECAGILNESLKEELAMASFLEKNSRAVLKRMASGGGGASTDGGGAGKASSRGGSSAAKTSRETGSSSAKKSAGSGSSPAKKSAGGGASSGRKSGGSSGGRARGGARA
jgi:ferritin-like metal-binding protein YciE